MMMAIHVPLLICWTMYSKGNKRITRMLPDDSILVPILLSVLIIIAFTIYPLLPRLKKALRGIVDRQLIARTSKQVDRDAHPIQISGLYIYPVKSLRGVSVPSTKLDSLGLEGDRRLMLVQPNPRDDTASPSTSTHRFVTQRQCGILATVNATQPINSMIQLSSHVVPDSTVSIDVSDNTLRNKYKMRYRAGIWDDVVEVVDVGDEAAAFIVSVIKADESLYEYFQDVRVVSMIPHITDRKADERYVPDAALSLSGNLPQVALTDGFPILLASEESLMELNRRLNTKGKTNLPMSRFRPNIVVRGLSKAFDEDTWKAIQIGGPDGPIFHIVKGCPRCKQSATDQLSGERDTEPLETLAEFRALGKNTEDVYFAQNVVMQPGSQSKRIKVGDTVQVLSTGLPVWNS